MIVIWWCWNVRAFCWLKLFLPYHRRTNLFTISHGKKHHTNKTITRHWIQRSIPLMQKTIFTIVFKLTQLVKRQPKTTACLPDHMYQTEYGGVQQTIALPGGRGLTIGCVAVRNVRLQLTRRKTSALWQQAERHSATIQRKKPAPHEICIKTEECDATGSSMFNVTHAGTKRPVSSEVKPAVAIDHHHRLYAGCPSPSLPQHDSPTANYEKMSTRDETIDYVPSASAHCSVSCVMDRSIFSMTAQAT